MSLLFLLCFVGVMGCDKSTPVAATQPVATSQPATQSGPATLVIGGEPSEFAFTQLTVSREAGAIHLILIGKDRPADPQSSFYFDLTLDGDDPEAIAGQSWAFKSTEFTPTDASVGIFLAGGAIKLVPDAFTLTFGGDYPNLTVTLTGEFLRDGDEVKRIKASGTFDVVGREK